MPSEMSRQIFLVNPFVADFASPHGHRLNLAVLDVVLRPVAAAVVAEVAPLHVVTKSLSVVEAAFRALSTRALKEKMTNENIRFIKKAYSLNLWGLI